MSLATLGFIFAVSAQVVSRPHKLKLKNLVRLKI
jgi:hypothetical protein